MLNTELPLTQRPKLRAMGRSVHGRVPVEQYQLKGLWCLHLYSYHAELSINGVELEIKPGDLGIAPENAELIYKYRGSSEHLFAHFEWKDSGPTWAAKVLKPMGADYAMKHRLFEEAVGLFPSEPSRAEVRIWDLLWGAITEEDARKPKTHPAVAEVVRQIELRLHEPLMVEGLAREIGLSHNHLTRLFRAATGQTVKGYLSQRRMAKARHLLEKSSTPIKQIAYSVGFEDLHAFNKAVRKELGFSPRGVRERGK